VLAHRSGDMTISCRGRRSGTYVPRNTDVE
jgi:hypothetical protein